MEAERPIELKQYRCHKVVNAAKIVGIEPWNNSHEVVVLVLDGHTTANVSRDYMRKHSPKIGGYFVQYEDGYRSFSPAEPFEAGYTLIQPVKSEKGMMTVEQIAGVCHEANRSYCAHMGDPSQPTWREAPEWQAKSTINGVQAILDDPTIGPEKSHEGWLAEKVADGWVYGPVKDPEKKLHPCIVPYNELPPEQAKEALFGSIVRSLSRLVAS